MEWWAVLLPLVAAALAAVRAFYAQRFRYWEARGVPNPPPWPVLGNLGTMIFGGKGILSVVDAAKPYRDKGYCGLFMGTAPVLLVWEPEMAKQILTKDFSSFHDRGQPSDENDPLSAHLFNLSGQKWRNLRNKLSPTFTSGKIKLMLPLMLDVSTELTAVLAAEAEAADNGEVDVHPVLGRFAADVIGTVAFGVQCHSLRDGSNRFAAMSQRVTGRSLGQIVRIALQSVHPRLVGLLPMKWIFPEEHRFFLDLMRDTVAYREAHPELQRPDFVQLMMQVRDHQQQQPDQDDHVDLRLMNNMAAQAFIFFVAGMDNVSNTLGYCVTRLAADPELQERVAAEVRGVLRRHDGALSYEALQQMELVDRVMMEGLRLWPVVGVLFRMCNETTRVGDVVVEKGSGAMVVTGLMHTDEAVFPEPHRFDPERHHSAEARERRHPYSFIPFGEGPRVCIAERFAKLEMRLALAVLVRDFAFSEGPNFEEEVALKPREFLPRPKSGFKVCVRRREAAADMSS